MTLESWDVVFYTILFVVPGYIIEEVISSIIPIRRFDEGIKLLRCLAYSILNNALWFSWGLRILKSICDARVYWFVLTLCVLITGLITGFVIGFIKAKGFIRDLFNGCFGRWGINLDHPTPSAWDYVFKKLTEGAWVTIRMDNDKFVHGLYYASSFASSDENYRDIYIETTYTIDDDDNWIKKDRTKGIWISPESIKSIEFYSIDESGKEEKNEREEDT